MERWKELPPITLDNTSISYLVTLIPVLVSMTSKDKRPQEPRFENETDKPAWWPPDVQWKNPKSYIHDHLEEDRLLILRKLVHSCYSYHGVEDLLCCLDEVPSPETDGLEVIELTEEERQDEAAPDSDGPVFLCCFCLDQFSSHEEVNSHQSICKNSLKQLDTKSPKPVSASNKGQHTSTDSQPAVIKSFLDIDNTEINDARTMEAPHFLTDVLCSRVSCAPVSSASTSSINQPVPVFLSAVEPQRMATSKPDAVGKPVRKPTTTPSNTYPFVPTLKTRSQKKLDQIMLKHNMKKKMLKECEEMKAVPSTGAWWRSRKLRRALPAQHPNVSTSQASFCASLGLGRSKDIKQEMNQDKEQQEVDLDCQIVLVEGPLSSTPAPQVESNSSQHSTATSPRSSKSLMSQLSRDTEESGRRRMSFRFLEDEWADKEALQEGRDPQQMSLLSIEFSSPLGIRIKKYMGGEGQYNIVKDPEAFCKTEDIDDSYGKLRVRANEYRVTFRKKRRASRFVHQYKFNSDDRREFKRILQTGLNARSRKIQRELRKCVVSLKKVTVSEIKEWTEGKKIIISEKIVVDDDICITQVDIPESQMRKALSQKRDFAQGYKPGPKCFAGLGRRYTPSSPQTRPAMASCGAPSPPHVPNIFRNRTAHAPSPPKFGSLGNSAVLSRFNHGNVPQSSTSQGRLAQQQRSTVGQPHLSRHPSLAPSMYETSRDIQQGKHNNSRGGSPSQVFTGHNSPNRRKQQLTHVRREDADSTVRPSQSYTNHFTSKPQSMGAHNHSVINNSSSSSSSAKLGRNLSNFDHFSIKNGKLTSSPSSNSPLSSSSSQRQHQRSQPAGHQSSLFKQQHHRSRPLPDWSNHEQRTVGNRPNRSFSLLSIPGQPSRSVPVTHGPQSRLQQQVRHSLVGSSHSAGKLSSHQSRLPAKPQSTHDMVELEVICIDDD